MKILVSPTDSRKNIRAAPRRGAVIAIAAIIAATSLAFSADMTWQPRTSRASDGSAPLAARAATPMFTCSTSLSAITPCTGFTSANTYRSGLTAQFTVQNKNRFEPVSYILSCGHTSQVIACSSPSGVTIPANSSQNVNVTYSTGASGSGTVTLTADDGFTPVTGQWTVTVNAPTPTPFPLPTVSPHYQLHQVDSAQTDTARFVVKNVGADSATFSFSSSCSGSAIVSSCTLSSSSSLLTPGQETTLLVSFTTGGSANAAGTVWLTATRSGDATMRDSGRVDVATTRADSLVKVSTVNAGATDDKDLCLTLSLGPGTAYECGDLRLVHVLPSVRTRNETRAPVLLYNSRQAHPRPIVRADVTLPDTRVPDSVTAALLDSNSVAISGASGSWSGSQWRAHSTRRVAVQFDGSTWPTGRHRYSLQVKRWYAGSAETVTVTGEFFIVNRSASPYGAGWWVAGLEQLTAAGSDLLWIGGDGSARRYVNVTTGVWAAANVDRPDTIKVNGSYYERYLPHKLIVRFDGTTLRHVQTITRLADTTRFVYKSGTPARLDSVVVPSGSLVRAYTFAYDGTPVLRSVSAPSVNGSRRFDSLTVSGSDISSIRVTGGASTQFGYGTETHRIVSRTNENGYTTSFGYGAGSVLDSATVPVDAGVNALTLITPAETRGLSGSAAVPLQLAWTKVDGPRTDMGDSTLFWTDRFGGVGRTRSALGDETVLDRVNATFPALVTRVRYPNGRILGATYDARGNVLTMTDSSTFNQSPLKYATTSFTWDATCDFVTKIANPEGDSTTFHYDGSTCNRDWQQDGRGSSTRVNFYYYASGSNHALMRSIHTPYAVSDSLIYSTTLVDLQRDIAPLGQYRAFELDSIGRVTADTTPVEGSTVLTARTTLDLRDRATRQVTFGPTGGITDSLVVTSKYDSVGNVVGIVKRSLPDTASVDSIYHTFTYDRRNLQLTETLVGYNTITSAYDLAGNLVSGGRTPAALTYDAMNRVVRRIASDTGQFAYDEVGNLRVAFNSTARTRRWYNANGTVKADTQWIVAYHSAERDFSLHQYGITSTYDLNGRRVSFVHPQAIAPASTPQRLHFTPDAGLVDTVVDVLGNRFAVRYDNAARLTGLTRRAQAADSGWATFGYDSLSQLIRRREWATGSVVLHNDSLTYDRRGKVRKNTIVGDTVGYTALGYVVEAINVPAGGHEQYRVDALGLRRFGLTFGEGPSSSLYHYQPHSERLDFAYHQQSPYADTTWYTQATTGALTLSQHVHPIQLNQLWYFEHKTTSNTYASDGKLLSAYYTVDTTPTPPNQPNYKVYHRTESYRYDAFGRRVWTQMLRDTANNNCQDHDRSSGCRNEVTRTVWDGDQILYELRAPDDTITNLGENDNASGGYNGRVGYTNVPALLGLDQPLDLFKSSTVVLPYTDWRGRFDKGTCPASLCTGIEFAGAGETVFHNQSPGSNGPPSWYGDVIADLHDGSGFEYRRNRYYDPQTGRFTTEDPIGLAGGLNLYGFANGDPANFGDPFGLLPGCDYRTGTGCSEEVMRLLKLDRPIQRPIIDPVAIATGGLVGMVRGLIGRLALGTGEAVTSNAVANQFTVQFGRVANQVSHTFRHVEELGLDRGLVRGAVEQDLQRVASEILPGRPFNRVIEVAGHRLQYTAFRVERELINVGRIHPVP